MTHDTVVGTTGTNLDFLLKKNRLFSLILDCKKQTWQNWVSDHTLGTPGTSSSSGTSPSGPNPLLRKATMNNMIVNKGGGEGGGVSPSPKQGSMIKDIMQKSQQQQQQQQQSQSKMSYSKEKKISFQLHQGSNENSESRGGKSKKMRRFCQKQAAGKKGKCYWHLLGGQNCAPFWCLWHFILGKMGCKVSGHFLVIHILIFHFILIRFFRNSICNLINYISNAFFMQINVAGLFFGRFSAIETKLS